MTDLKIVKNDSNRLLDMNEASAFLGIKKSTLYQMVMRKKITHLKLTPSADFYSTHSMV